MLQISIYLKVYSLFHIKLQGKQVMTQFFLMQKIKGSWNFLKKYLEIHAIKEEKVLNFIRRSYSY